MIINNTIFEEKRLVIADKEYEAFIETIRQSLLIFFDNVTYKEARSGINGFARYLGFKNGWMAVCSFNIEEWYSYYVNTGYSEAMKERLIVLQYQYTHSTLR
jgi:hypothetical protein